MSRRQECEHHAVRRDGSDGICLECGCAVSIPVWVDRTAYSWGHDR
jgi:hypothetical protein